MDATKFEERMLLDTSVMILALEYDNPARVDDPHLKDCRELWVDLLASSDTTVYIASLTLLEFLRFPNATQPPPAKKVVYAGFDYRTAIDTSKWATTANLKDIRDGQGTTRRVVSYDALIVGTARAYNVDCIVTLDAGVHSLANKAGLTSREPAYFRGDPKLF